jgi:MFS family permease
MVGASFIAEMTSAGAGVYLLGVMLVPMQEALNTSRTVISLGLTIRQIVTAITGPFVGPIVDRKDGAKWVMVIAGFLGGVSLMLTGLAQAPWQFLLTFGVGGGIGALASGFLVVQVLLSKWFVRQRGRAIALAAMGINVGGLIIIPLATWLISAVGWRAVWLVVGILVWVLIIPVALFVVKTQPEDMGLRPDGDPPIANPTTSAISTAGERKESTEVHWTRREAFRTPTLWLLLITFNLAGAELSGTVIHQKAYLQEQGVSNAMAAAAFTAFVWASFSGKPFWGFIIDKINTHLALVLIYFMTSLGLGMMLIVDNVPTAFLASLVFGISVSATSTIQAVVWASYYGRNFLGSIRGMVAPFSLIANAGGPVMAAAVHDATNSYAIPFSLFLAFALAATATALFARPPTKQPALRGIEA